MFSFIKKEKLLKKLDELVTVLEKNNFEKKEIIKVGKYYVYYSDPLFFSINEDIGDSILNFCSGKIRLSSLIDETIDYINVIDEIIKTINSSEELIKMYKNENNIKNT